MLNEFKAFIMRGNVVDLAVGVVIALAFAAVVTSLVDDIITPLIGIFGVPDFSSWTIVLGDAELRPGLFLNAVISFLIIAAVIFFLVIKPMNRLQSLQDKGVVEEDKPEEPTEVQLLAEIRDELRRSRGAADTSASD